MESNFGYTSRQVGHLMAENSSLPSNATPRTLRKTSLIKIDLSEYDNTVLREHIFPQIIHQLYSLQSLNLYKWTEWYFGKLKWINDIWRNISSLEIPAEICPIPTEQANRVLAMQYGLGTCGRISARFPYSTRGLSFAVNDLLITTLHGAQSSIYAVNSQAQEFRSCNWHLSYHKKSLKIYVAVSELDWMAFVHTGWKHWWNTAVVL